MLLTFVTDLAFALAFFIGVGLILWVLSDL